MQQHAKRLKVCVACRKRKRVEKFHVARDNADGRKSRCARCCNERSKASYEADLAAQRERQRQYYRENRQTILDRARASYTKERGRRQLLKQYGLTPKQFDRMFDEQQGCCAICDDLLTTPHIDHDHGTGAVRGLLCKMCNWGLGHFRDEPAHLRSAIDYLERV